MGEFDVVKDGIYGGLFGGWDTTGMDSFEGLEGTIVEEDEFYTYSAVDPMSIISQTASEAERIEASRMFGTAGLYSTMQATVVILAVIMIACSLIGMLFVGKAEVIAEKKKDVMHKLLIVFLGGSFVTVLNIVMFFIESVVR